MAKYYPVYANDCKKIFTDWDTAKRFIAQYPNGAKYKKCDTEEQASKFLEDIQSFIDPTQPITPQTEKELLATLSGSTAIAYTDGSFDSKTGLWGAGAIVYDSKCPDRVFTDIGCGTEYNQHRNVTGELVGALLAINRAISERFDNLILYHDYEGVGKWADKNWKAKIELTKIYAQRIEELRKEINIIFLWVKSHAGTKHNEWADKLAAYSISNREIIILSEVFQNSYM